MWRVVKPSDVPELGTVVSLYREVVARLSPQNPDRPMILNDFSVVLSAQFDKMGKLADLEEAVLLGRETLKLRPPPDPNRSASLQNLARDLSN